MIHSENCHDDLIDLILKYFLNQTLTPSQYAPTPEHGLSHCHICGLVSMLEEVECFSIDWESWNQNKNIHVMWILVHDINQRTQYEVES